MGFYQQIAPYYHHIFKINVHQVEFIKLKIPKRDSSILDIGCGTGTLSLALGEHYQQVLGIDLDPEMIRAALNRKEKASKSIQFRQINMLTLDQLINDGPFDGVVCFGNTLVHLSSMDEISLFLQQVKSNLTPGGRLLLQIVNYDKILGKNIQQLPTIDNDEIIFERSYGYRESENRIDFHTRLTIKRTQEIIKNRIELLPLLKSELTTLLNEAGLAHHNYYGNFNGDPHSIDSPATIVEAW
ncbi:class I SAM-dependent methyltransferase [Arenibacter amylolyticus]|uniref:class I SAM-dependent methyltransferase n=1 Tax=Arenibacter amylolyticus TaxID=1406873 RepID=UPI000A3C1F4C|nr:class I SAM-dependent methyltransferase [Arenibacter amylolyticus]